MSTQTIKFKGEFDVSSILNSIKQMRTELSKQNSPLLGNLDKEISKLETLGPTIKAQMEKGFASNKEFKSFESSMEKFELNIGKISQKFKEINADNLEISTKKINDQLEETKKKAKEIQDAFKKNFNESMLNIAKDSKEINKELVEMARQGRSFNEAQERANQLYDERLRKTRELIALQQSLVNNSKSEVDVLTGGIKKEDFYISQGRGKKTQAIDDSTFGKIQQAWIDAVKGSEKAGQAQDKFRASLEQLGVSRNKAAMQNAAMTKELKRYQEAVAATDASIKQQEKALKDLQNQENAIIGEKSRYNAALQSERNGYEQAASSAIQLRQAEEQANVAKAKATALNEREANSINNVNASINKQIEAFRNDSSAVSAAVKSQENLNSTLDNLKNRIAYVLSMSNAFYQVRRAITQTLNDVQSIDKAFASIAMVTDKTVSGLWQHYGEYAQMAQKLGQSTESAIKASALFYQQGLKDAEVMQLTEETMKLATLAGLDFEQATSQMTAALRGFHMEMDQGAHVTDVYSELAAHAAADVNGIAYAMSKTASIANNAGMSFENTAAMLTQMIETTQEAPENIGTAMKTIIARFTELKKNIAGTAESEFEDLDYNKVDTALKSVGVQLKDTTGQFRNLDDVFLELSEKWNTLDRNSQRYIATIAAGSRQQSRFIAMMEDYDRTMQLVNITQDANNRANEQFAKNAESLPFKIQELKTAWEQFRLSIADSSTFKGIIDSLTNIVNTLNSLDKKTLVTISLIGATAGKAIVLGFLKSIKEMAFALRESISQSGELIAREWNKALNKIRVQKGGAQIINNADLVQTKALLKEIGLEESLINAKTAELVLNYVKQRNEIEQELLQLENIYNKNGELNSEEIERYNRLQEQLRVLAQQSLILKGMNVDMEKLNANTQLANIAGGYQSSSNVKAQNAFVAGAKPIIGSAVSSALTTALVMSLSGADLKTTMKTAFTTALITAIPQVMKAVGPKLISAITTKVITPLIAAVGAIPLIIAAAVAAIAVGLLIFHKQRMKKIKEAHDAEINRLKEIEKKNKELANEAQSASTEVKNKTQERETFVENKKRYDDLSKRTFLVNSEKEELQNLFNYFTENYSDVIDTTDENTMAIKFNTNAVEALTDSFDAEIKENQQKANLAQNQLVENLLWQYKKINEVPDIVDDVIDIVTYGENGQLEDYYDWAIWANKDEETERYMLKSLATLDSAILKDLGLEIEDLNNFKTFNKYLSESGLNLGTFNKKLKESISEHNTEEGLNSKLQKAAATAYRNMNVEDVDMNVVLADMFASTVTEDDVTRKRIVTRGRESGAKQSNTGGSNHKKGGTYSKTWLDELATNGLYKLMYTGANSDEAEALSTEQWDYVKGVFQRRGTSVDDISDFVTSESNTNLVKWEDLTKDFREYLEKEKGLDSSSWDKNRKKAYDSVGYISDYIDWAIEQDQNMLTAFTEEELEAEKEGLEKYNELYSTASELTQEQYNKKLEEVLDGINNENIKNKLVEGENSFANSITKRFEQVMTDFTSIGLNPDDWKQMSLKAQEGLVSRIKDISRKSTDAKEFAKIFQDLYANYGEAAVKILSSIPIEEGFGIITEKSDEYIQALVDAGYDLEEATEMFNDYLERAFNILPAIGTSSGSGELFNTLIQKDVQGFKETNEVLLEAQKEFLENGKLTSDTYFKMMEAGLDKYVKVSAQGYEFLADVADKYLTNDALGGLKALNDEISRQQKGLELINSARRATEGYDSDNWNNDKNLIKKYKDDKDAVESWLNAGLIDENTFNMVALAASKGYTSLKQLDDEARAYLATISSSKEQVYIQGLVTISETYSELTEKVKELKDNIEDLTETVDKNREALDEAEKKLYETRHGTELFQSSLDGLINYNSQLEKVNSNIDDIKDGLSDISNLSDGQALLESLSTNYNKKQANLSAQNIVIDDALNNLRDTLLSNYGQFIKFNGDQALIDFNYLNMDANDELRKAFEKEYSTYEDYLKKKESNNKEIKTLNKDREKFEKEALNNYTDIQKEVIDILKEQAKEEVDITKDKYDALKDADDDYISALEEAIQKQRELRDKEKSEEELAQKEKKLSLMQRDTSGANAKDIQKLQQEIENDREKLLDDNIDSIINNMKELYEKQAEARDAEIEYMESVTENAQYFNEWAQNIVESWENVEDMQDWFLSNNPDVQDMTVEQTELYIQDIQDKWTDLVTYQSLKVTDFKANTDAIETEMTALYETTSENISKVGTDIQQLAEKNAAEAEKAAQKARDEAQKTYDDSLEKLHQAQDELRIAEGQAVKTHQEAMNEMVAASEKGLKDVSTYATSMLLEWAGVDVHNPEEVNKWAKENHKGNGEGEIGSELYDALQNQGVDMSNYNKGIDQYMVWFSPDAPGTPAQLVDSFNNQAEAEAIKAEYDRTHSGGSTSIQKISLYGKHKYATGGLVPYTGIAQVDGSPSRPEAFLSAEDTQRFMTAAELFAMSPLLNSASAQNAVSSSIGDTSIEININVESISDDYDVDRLIKRVEDDINETARPVGTQVILNKRV